MNKKTQALLILFIIVMLLLIVAEYNNQFKQDNAAIQYENMILQARIDVNQAKIEDLKIQIERVNGIASKQQEITSKDTYRFYVENTELFEGIGD